MKFNALNVRPPLIKRKRIWTFFENQMMLAFLHSKRQEIEDHITENISSERRTNKNMFFKQMSEYIKTKSDLQCKSRYQKVETNILYLVGIDERIVHKYLELKAKKRTKKKISKKILTNHISNESMSTHRQSRRLSKKNEICAEWRQTQHSGESSFVKKEGWKRVRETSFKFNKDYFIKKRLNNQDCWNFTLKRSTIDRSGDLEEAIFIDE